MYCNKCGQVVADNDYFCPNCGCKIGTCSSEIVDKPTEKKCWRIFGNIGYVLGIVSIVSCLFMGLGGFIAIDGIIFSALGKKSKVNYQKAKSGLIMNIIACAIGVPLFFIMYIFLLAGALAYA